MKRDKDLIVVPVLAAEDLFCVTDLGLQRTSQGTRKILKLACSKGQEVFFRIKVDTTFEKLFSTFCERHDLDPKSLVFKMRGGKQVHSLDSALSIDLEDGDQLMVYQCEHYGIDPTMENDAVGTHLSKMLYNAHLSDVIFEVGPQRERISAHRCILASRSPKFEGLFSGHFSESSAAEIKLPTQEAPVFKLLLSYLYTNKVEMPSATASVILLLVMADEYLCRSLKKRCEEELLKRLCLDNMCELFCAAKLHELRELVDISKRLIISNFQDLPEEGLELLKREPDLLLEVARSGIRPSKRARTST